MYKRLLTLTILLLVVVVPCSYSQNSSIANTEETASFRNRALGGIINDDLDLIYDPIELNYVRNLRVYTNLSNLTSTNEKIFNNQSDNMYFIGVSRQNPFVSNLTHSILFSFQKAKNPGSVGINSGLSGSSSDITGQGFLENMFSKYYDIGSDGLYDNRESIYQEKTFYRENSGYNFVLNNSIIISDIIFGLKVSAGDSKSGNTLNSSPFSESNYSLSGADYGDPSFQRNYTLTDINLNTTLKQFSEKGAFNSNSDNPYASLDLSTSVNLYQSDITVFELRGDLLYSKYKQDNSRNNTYTGSYAGFKPSVDSYLLNYGADGSNAYNSKENGYWYGLAGEVRFVFNRQTNRIDEGFVKARVEYIHSSFDYSENSFDSYFTIDKQYDPSSTSKYLKNSSNISNSDNAGTGNDNNWKFSTNVNTPLADGAYFGLGFIIKYQTRDINSKNSNGYTNISKLSSLDNAHIPTLSSTTTIDWQADEDTKGKNSVTEFIAPVGIEYRFTESKNWAIRFGSIFRYTKSVYDNTLQATRSNPRITKTEQSGNTTINIDPNAYSSSSYQRITSVSNTTFTYGLGYVPSENLQIDLIGFFDVNNNVTLLEYVKALRLSFVVKW